MTESTTARRRFITCSTSSRLGPLNEQEARDLVSKPMAQLGVTFGGDKVVDTILDLGPRPSPWLLQLMCKLLLERLDARRGGDRVITVDDVTTVYNGEEFSPAA